MNIVKILYDTYLSKEKIKTVTRQFGYHSQNTVKILYELEHQEYIKK
jgi:hypothetical protein